MTLILETGSGIQSANSYILPSFVTTYLTNLNRQTENTWSTRTTAEQEAACIAATQYIDTRWGPRLKGIRDVFFKGRQSVARITLTGQPAADDTFTLGDQTYTMKSSLDELSDNQVLIAATTSETASNIIKAINVSGTAGTEYSQYMRMNDYASALVNTTTDTIIDLTAFQIGSEGNDTTLTESLTNATVSTFAFGEDDGPQPLEFPRDGLYDRNGDKIVGIPRPLKEACAEYAVRSLSASLYADPTVDDTGRAVTEKFEKVGPIEERTVYEDGASLSNLIKPYPAADRLLRDYITNPGATR